uniref:Uncharacterized protein n=1 Tax=Craspedostauros australis TaxID=1486917 RepID=A0A7R9ZJY5_9STRA
MRVHIMPFIAVIGHAMLSAEVASAFAPHRNRPATTATAMLARTPRVLGGRPAPNRTSGIPSSSSAWAPRSFPSTAQRTSATSLTMSVDNYSSIALKFFTSVRVPSALIAGSSLGSLFTLLDDDDDDDEEGDGGVKIKMTPQDLKLRRWIIRIYHFFGLVTLMLSLNAIVTSTAAATTLMLGRYSSSTATSVYAFMEQHMKYEFVTTRWSFLTSMLSFIAGIAMRALVEFNLYRKGNRKNAAALFFCLFGLWSHLLSFVNSTLYSSPNIFLMTWEVLKLVFVKAFVRPRKFLEMASVLSFATSFVFVTMIVLDKKSASGNVGGASKNKDGGDDEDERECAEEMRLGGEVAVDQSSGHGVDS